MERILTPEQRAAKLVPCIKAKYCPPRTKAQGTLGAFGTHDISCLRQYINLEDVVKAFQEAMDDSRKVALTEAAKFAEDCVANGVTVLSAGEVRDAILSLIESPINEKPIYETVIVKLSPDFMNRAKKAMGENGSNDSEHVLLYEIVEAIEEAKKNP